MGSTFVDKNDYPREAIFEAILRFVEEDLVQSGRLEEMARRAQQLTRMHFGRTIGLYVPLYISNHCEADCTGGQIPLRQRIRNSDVGLLNSMVVRLQ